MEIILQVLGNWLTALGLMLIIGIIISLGLVIFTVVVRVISIVVIEIVSGFKQFWKEVKSKP